MTEKERISRRSFLKAAGISALGLSLGSSAPRFENPEFNSADAERFIKTPEKFAFNLGPGEGVEVVANPQAFYDAIIALSESENGKDGIRKVKGLLSKRGLLLSYSRDILWSDYIMTKTIPNEIYYLPSFWIGGPKITFSQAFLERYLRIEKEGDDVDRLFKTRLYIYHELFHIWQEARSLPRFLWESSTADLYAYASEFNVGKFHPSNHPAEIEAWEKPWKLIEKKLFSGGYNNGRLENFFDFKTGF